MMKAFYYWMIQKNHSNSNEMNSITILLYIQSISRLLIEPIAIEPVGFTMAYQRVH